MSRRLMGVTVVVLALTVAAACLAAPSPIKWGNSLDKGLATAKTSSKVVLADFATSWCGWCKKLDSDVYPNAKVTKIIDDHFVPVKLDGDKEKALDTKYKVTGYPTIVILDGDGAVLKKIVGYMPVDAFLAELKDALDLQKLAGQEADLQKQLSTADAAGKAKIDATTAYIEMRLGHTKKAAALVKEAKAGGVDTPELALTSAMVLPAGAGRTAALTTWLQNNPTGTLRPEALYELGMSQAEQQKWDDSVASLDKSAAAQDAGVWGVRSATIAGIIRERYLKPDEQCTSG